MSAAAIQAWLEPRAGEMAALVEEAAVLRCAAVYALFAGDVLR